MFKLVFCPFEFVRQARAFRLKFLPLIRTENLKLMPGRFGFGAKLCSLRLSLGSHRRGFLLGCSKEILRLTFDPVPQELGFGRCCGECRLSPLFSLGYERAVSLIKLELLLFHPLLGRA